LKPWSLVTYGFTHIEFWHLFMNMFVLYFVGSAPFFFSQNGH
jgi:membrane associated rhomboid family serine protease